MGNEGMNKRLYKGFLLGWIWGILILQLTAELEDVTNPWRCGLILLGMGAVGMGYWAERANAIEDDTTG